MKFKPNANASKRTKNRFREHTIVPVEEFEGFFFKDDRTLADMYLASKVEPAKQFAALNEIAKMSDTRDGLGGYL